MLFYDEPTSIFNKKKLSKIVCISKQVNQLSNSAYFYYYVKLAPCQSLKALVPRHVA